MSARSYPAFLHNLIEHPPTAGAGVHDWMFDVARNLHAHLPAVEIEVIIRTKLANCGRPVPEREIKAAIKNSVDYAWKPKGDVSGTHEVRTPPPKPDLCKIESLVRAGLRYADLIESSPMQFDHPASENVIDMLFPGNPLLCCGKEIYRFDTRPREQWRGWLGEQQFLVPSPMTKVQGKTQEGKDSRHTVDNTGDRRFLVIEFDFSIMARDGKTPTVFAPMIRSLLKDCISVGDMCAALLMMLHKLKPLTMAVDSGGKSIHGWWRWHGEMPGFWRYAQTLGADPRTWLRSQFIRMPDGRRDNGRPQPLLYFDPSTLPPDDPCRSPI